MNNTSSKLLKQILINMLDEFILICNKYNLKYNYFLIAYDKKLKNKNLKRNWIAI